MAACSVWDNSQILSEVVVAMPRPIELVGRLRNWKPLSRLRLPPIPRLGEAIRSWYVFDLHSTHHRSARALMRFVAGRAAQQRIDYCYAHFQNSDSLLDAVRADVNKAIAPLAPYRMFAYSTTGLVEPMSRIYVDIRDL